MLATQAPHLYHGFYNSLGIFSTKIKLLKSEVIGFHPGEMTLDREGGVRHPFHSSLKKGEG